MNNIIPFEYYEDVNTSGAGLLAPLSVSDILSAIASFTGDTKRVRENLASAVQSANKILLANTVPVGVEGGRDFTCINLNSALYAGSPALFGLRPKRFQAVVTRCRTVLRSLGRHAPDTRGVSYLAPDWRTLHDSMETAYADKATYRRAAQITFMIYCSGEAIRPEAVTDQTLADFEAFLTTRTITPDIPGRVRRVASNWNSAAGIVPGWPATRLTRAGMRDQYTLRFDAFPPSFGADTEDFLGNQANGPEDDGLSGAIFLEEDENAPKRRTRSLKPRTIETRRWHIRQAAGTLVQLGVPPAEFRSLADLVCPLERVRNILRYLKERARRQWQVQGRDVALRDVRSSNITGIADALRQIAKYHVRLPEVQVAAIGAMVSATKPLSTGSMSEKNAERLTALAQPRIMAMLLHLPEFIVYPERFLKPIQKGQEDSSRKSPRKAALDAMYGALLEIGLICPMRRANLADLSLDRHLQWDAGRKRILALMIPAGEVKNTTLIRWPMPSESNDLIQTYINLHRPLLTSGSANRFLFPNSVVGPRGAHDLSVETIERVEGLLGVEFNLHLLRHIAVLRHLTHHPGDYETVRLLLGHKSVVTTIQFYAGLEAEAAARHYDALLSADRKKLRVTAVAAFGVVSRPRFGRGGS